MGKQTPLYPLHLKANAKIVDFAGWDMPLHYGSQIQEHHYVRSEAGMFDVSHMGVVDIEGGQACAFLKYLLANNVDKLNPGKALYTCMLNEQGRVIDDLIVYYRADNRYRLVINAGTREKDLAWIRKQAKHFDVEIIDKPALAILAVQGPQAMQKVQDCLPQDQAQVLSQLKPFHFVDRPDYFIAKTGYTGEDGYEMILSAEQALHWWQQLLQAGVKPCGLGARDTLRLEAGLNLYGADMDEKVTPLESNLSWTVAWEPKERDFIGRAALETQQEQGVKQQLVGLVLEGQGIIRNHQKVRVQEGEGEVTSGGYSPTLEQSIALARIPTGNHANTCLVEIRNKQVAASIIKPPFVRHGKKVFGD